MKACVFYVIGLYNGVSIPFDVRTEPGENNDEVNI